MSEPSTNSVQIVPTLLARAFVWVAVPTLLFVQLFVTFRGLSSPTGMEHAQLARELARGNGFHTKLVRPYSWRQMIDGGKESSPLAARDTFSAPLQPLLLAPVFKAFASFWPYESGDPKTPRPSVYFMDRVVASVSLLFFLGASAIAWLTAQRLFDRTIAGWTFVSLMVCQLLWDVARSGLPQMLVLFFFSVALHQLASALERTGREESVVRQAVVIGCMGALMLLAHWLALSLVAGLVVAAAWRLRPRLSTALTVALPSLIVLTAWGVRNHGVCGDFFGSFKATMQSALALSSDSWLLRDFSRQIPPTASDFLVKKVFANTEGQIHHLWPLLGGALPALLFFPALLHPFRRQDVREFSWCLGVTWLLAVLGMALVGLPLKAEDANQLHSVFIPAMAPFGFAFIAVLWTRLGFGQGHLGWWTRHGAAAGACLITLLPMLVTLPTEMTIGLTVKGQFAHWPPYLPEKIADVRDFALENEFVMSDAPWAVAWYADRTSVWLPLDRRQFFEMRDAAAHRGSEVAGFLITPESLRGPRPADIFSANSEYHDWTPLVFRGLMAGFGVDVAGIENFEKMTLPCKEIHPLFGQPGNGRFVVELAFMSDRKAWEKKAAVAQEKTATAETGAGSVNAPR